MFKGKKVTSFWNDGNFILNLFSLSIGYDDYNENWFVFMNLNDYSLSILGIPPMGYALVFLGLTLAYMWF